MGNGGAMAPLIVQSSVSAMECYHRMLFQPWTMDKVSNAIHPDNIKKKKPY